MATKTSKSEKAKSSKPELMFKVESEIPIPPKHLAKPVHNDIAKVLKTMKVKDSFFIPKDIIKPTSVTTTVKKIVKMSPHLGRDFAVTIRQIKDQANNIKGMRVWRIN